MIIMELLPLKDNLEKLSSIPWKERNKMEGYSDIKRLLYQLACVDETRQKITKKYKNKIKRLEAEVAELRSTHKGFKKKSKLPSPPKEMPNPSRVKCYMCRKPHIIFRTEKDRKICPDCVILNTKMRELKSDFSKKSVLITGGRIKVGYHTALHFLRSHALVIITTRFPTDALKRYAAELDFKKWKKNLHIVGADFTSQSDLDNVVQTVKKIVKKLDILINNAAQTIRRPKQFYKSLMDQEFAAITDGTETKPAFKGQLIKRESKRIGYEIELDRKFEGDTSLFPTGEVDIDGQQIDLRKSNGWCERIEEVDILECVETQVINSIAPFYLIQNLLPIMKQKTDYSWILNITSAEGRFDKDDGQGIHPHNNMSKAALNMITKTIAKDCLKEGVVVSSIDIGWVNNMGPMAQVTGGMALLSYEDAVARILHPIEHVEIKGSGKLFRHYKIREVW